MSVPKIRIDVETTFEGSNALVVSCYFDRICPVPSRAKQDFLASLAEGEGKSERERVGLYLGAVCALFDASCVEVRVNDEPVPVDKVGPDIKDAAVAKITEAWNARVKAQGQP